MIVLTSVNNQTFSLCPGDEFHLTVKDEMGFHILVKEVVTVNKTINFVASFRFAFDDGTCPSFHLCGFFGNKEELPSEMENAVMLGDLTVEQLSNFKRTVGIAI